MTKSTLSAMAAAGAIALSLGLASTAVADFQYWVPVCTGNAIPINAACRNGGPQGTPVDSAATAGPGQVSGSPADALPAVSAGANPYVPIGVGN